MQGHKYRSESTFVRRMHGSASTLGNIVQHVPPSITHASHDAGALSVALVVKLAFDSLPIGLHHLHCSSFYPCTLAASYNYQNTTRVEYEGKFHLNPALKARAEWLGTRYTENSAIRARS